MLVNTTGSLGQFLEGVRAKFFQVFDQGQAEVAHYDLAELMKASHQISPLVERLNAAGRQKIEATSVTGTTQLLQPTGEAEPFKEMDFLPSYITAVQPFKFTGRIRVTREAVERTAVEYRAALDEVSKLKG
ncbi:MAG TPA: hypothetical protein VN922_09155, partial [Bacteroidia bacterium]|nr:hypothetical protein [Bacteroidia bacterium]